MSVTWATNGLVKAVLTVADWVAPEETAMVVAVPALLVSEKVGGVVSPEALVVTEKAPAVWLVVKVEALALPLTSVATRQVVNEPLLPPEQVPNVPEAPEAGAVKVTTMPETGLP